MEAKRYPRLAAEVAARLETPAVIVDRRILQANINRMQRVARRAGVHLRPHVKTHKSITLARQQIAAGAVGITAAKVDEALVFIKAQLPSVTLAHPQISAAKLDRLLAAARHHDCDLRLIVDSPEGLALIAARAAALGSRPGVFIKIDVGLHRCGRPPDDPLVFSLAQTIDRAEQLNFRGILSHAGQAYGAEDGAAAEHIAESERQMMVALAGRLRTAGFKVPEVSVGSTPTVLATAHFEGLTEIRPGNYVFMDQTPLRLGLVLPGQIALSVLTTVVSTNAHYAIVDAGAKTLSSDRGAHGTTGIEGYGVGYRLGDPSGAPPPLMVAKLSEEHGFIIPGADRLQPGDRLQIFPNHACPVVNLARKLVVVDGASIDFWAVDAAGCVR
jgi:D-serine deaminase-like pyridoxal phosphate-dependent protein